MADQLSTLVSDVKAGRIAPVYYLCGERFPVEQVVTALKKAVLAQGESAFNYDHLLAGEARARGILDAARTIPMLGAQRLVLVRDAHLLHADDLAQLLPYVKDPNPSTCLAMVGDKADLRLKFFTELKKSGVVARFDPLKDRQVAPWLTGEARRQKIALKPGAAERIAEAVGTDMGQLASAIERLSLYVGPGAAISVEDVDAVLAQTRQRSIFELTNAVGRGQRQEALAVLHKMLLDREPAVRIVTMLARHLRQLWSTHELVRRGADKNAIASAVGIHPFFVGDMIQQARRFSPEALRRTHRALFLADRSLKSSRLPDSAILEKLVLSLCPAQGGARR